MITYDQMINACNAHHKNEISDPDYIKILSEFRLTCTDDENRKINIHTLMIWHEMTFFEASKQHDENIKTAKKWEK